MTEQELRDEFEKWYYYKSSDYYGYAVPNSHLFENFRAGYSLAQETIKAKDAEIERLKSTFAGYENFKENDRQLKAINEARELKNEKQPRGSFERKNEHRYE